MEKEAKQQMVNVNPDISASVQSVKLQKYTITPFEGDYKDWTRLWNQFSVEVDGANISDISKFNYLLELIKGKPREDILGLPHTKEGYIEAIRILESTYGKDIKVQRALIKELEGLPVITSIRKEATIHKFSNKLSRAVRTLATMEKLATCQDMVYTIMDKLGPVREILAQSDDNGKNGKLKNSLTIYVNTLNGIHWMTRIQNTIGEMVTEGTTVERDHSSVSKYVECVNYPQYPTYCSPSRSTATMEGPVRVNPTHHVNISRGRKPEYPETTHDFRPSVD